MVEGNIVDLRLLHGVLEGCFDSVMAALGAGANVDGSPEQPFTPIVAATMVDDARMVDCLLRQGANPDRPVDVELPCPGSDMIAVPGERALHLATRSGKVGIAGLLLNRARADPNATDNRGCTPLLATCLSPPVCVEEVVRLLLEAGADPALADGDGFIPLHPAALNGLMGVVDMLYSAASTTINRCTPTGETPLYAACVGGHESVVSKLLSLGAMQPMLTDIGGKCPLAIAVSNASLGVVRVLLNEGGVRAVGGEMALVRALGRAVEIRQARILRLLLSADGDERRSGWANATHLGRNLLHHGAAYCYPAAVGILLDAGADEAERDAHGRIPRDVIGLGRGLDDEVRMDRGKRIAIHRMLQRGHAYRARSWAWPSDGEVHVGASSDSDTAAAAVAAAVTVLSSPPAVKPPPTTGVRIIRPKERSSSKLFARLVGRYCAKD